MFGSHSRPVVSEVKEKVFTTDSFSNLGLHPHLVRHTPTHTHLAYIKTHVSVSVLNADWTLCLGGDAGKGSGRFHHDQVSDHPCLCISLPLGVYTYI